MSFTEESKKARKKRAKRVKAKPHSRELGAPLGKPGDGTLDRVLREAAAASDGVTRKAMAVLVTLV